MADVPLIDARVTAMTPLVAGIVEIAIAPASGGPLPSFGPGAHILCEVSLPDGTIDTRAYSLVNAPGDRAAYRIAVQREESGRGGSRFMHALAHGAPIRVGVPRNDFPLVAGAVEHVLIAGGIGVTPILAMARALGQAGAAHSIYYVGRDRAGMAYAGELADAGGSVVCDGGDPARGIDLVAAIGAPAEGRHVYVCGPRGLIEAVRNAAEAAGWPESHVRFELFAAEAARVGDGAFEVELRQSGIRLMVAPDASILDGMIAAGIDPLFDCRRGECGLCAVGVIGGVPDHRDMNLSQREREAGKVICTCVSRSRTPLLVLDA